MPTYDLRRENWIPAVREDRPASLGLEAALLGAHTIQELRDPVPILEFGLYRLLTALCLDIFRPQNHHDVGELLQRGALPPDRIRDYFRQYADRFDLFHESLPFLQSASLKGAEKKPVALLHPAIPSGSNALHFHRADESDFAVCPAVAARLLCAAPAFMTMGGAGLSPSINGAPPWYVLVRGRNLFETLLLNARAHISSRVDGLGEPAWRRTGDLPTGKQKGASLLASLTWQPRRILFFPEGGGVCSLSGARADILIRTMAFVAGAAVDFAWEDDPNVAYRMTAKGTFPIRPAEGRDVWRDTGALAFAQRTDAGAREGTIRPGVVEHFAQLFQGRYLARNQELRLQVYGMRTDLKTKVFEWQREELSPPVDLVLDRPLANRAIAALDQAEKVSAILRLAVRRAYPRDGKSNPRAFDNRIGAAHEQYWSALRRAYEEFLARVSVSGDASDSEDAWRRQVEKAGRDALNDAIDDLDADAQELRRQTEARAYFRRAVWKLFNPQPTRKS